MIPTTSEAMAAKENQPDQTTATSPLVSLQPFEMRERRTLTTSCFAASHHHELVHHRTIVDIERVHVGRRPLGREAREVVVLVLLLWMKTQSSCCDGC